MEQLIFLHISDLHRGQPGDEERWPSVEEVVIDDIRAMTKEVGQPDVILFTGDLAFSGRDPEYRKVEDTLRGIQEALSSDPILVTVPGNHDLSRPPESDPALLGFKQYLKTDGAHLRKALLRSERQPIEYIERIFQCYQEFWKRAIKPQWDRRRDVNYMPGLLPGDFTLTIERGGLRVGLAGLNSAFLQQYPDPADSEEYFVRKVIVEPMQVSKAQQNLARWSQDHDAAFLLMHHPPDWLNNRDAFERDIYVPRWFQACLFGHMHRSRYVEEGYGTGVQRRYLQSPSLFGLEHWGTHREARAVGYSWLRLSRTGSEAGRLERWVRQGSIGDSGAWEIDALTSQGHRSYDFPLRKQTPRVGVRAAVMAVTSELGRHRQSVADMLRRTPQIAHVEEIKVELAGSDASLPNAELLVVLLGSQVGSESVVGAALRTDPRPIVLATESLALNQHVPPQELMRSLELRQRAEDIFKPASLPTFDPKSPENTVLKARDAVAAWLDARTPVAQAERLSLLPFERAYLQQMRDLWERGRHGPLLAMSQLDGTQGIDRSKLYVSLRAEASWVYLGEAGEVVLTDGSQPTESTSGERRAAYLEQVLSHRHLSYLVIEGEAGSGKTVLLQHVALVLAQTHLGEPRPEHRLDLESLQDGRPLVPVPILVEVTRLADHLKGVDPGIQDFCAALAQEVARLAGHEVNSDVFTAGLKAGRYLLLLDSLDEIGDQAQRTSLVRCLEGLSRQEQMRARIALTTRPSAFTGNGSYGGRFRKVRVSSLQTDTQQAVVQRYCAAFSHTGAYQDQLLAAIAEIRDRHGAANLAENPLMLTITMLVYEAQRRLPDSTAELYRRIVEILCQTRRRPAFPLEIRRQALELIAEGAQQAGTVIWPVSDAVRILQEKMPYQFPTVAETQEKIDWLGRETGLLRFEKSDDGIMLRAWHRSFQEYLAACRIAGGKDAVEAVTDRLFEPRDQRPPIVEDPNWQGVLRFLVGVYGGQQAERAQAYVERLHDYATRKQALPPQVRAARVLALVATGLAEYKEHFGGHRLVNLVREEVVSAYERDGSTWPLRDRTLALDALGRLDDPRLERKLWVELPPGKMRFASNAETKPEAAEIGRLMIAWRPVAVADFQKFIKAGGYQDQRFWTDMPERDYDAPANWARQSHHPNYPVTGVSFWEAIAYCRWVTESGLAPSGWIADLPTEAEWRYACGFAGVLGKLERFPWGDQYLLLDEGSQANCFRMDTDSQHRFSIMPIGCFPLGTRQGIVDLVGNVGEWGHTTEQLKKFESTPIVKPNLGMPFAQLYEDNKGGSVYGPPAGRNSQIGFRMVCRPTAHPLLAATKADGVPVPQLPP